LTGKFITFDGPEGGGKSTQIEKLRSYLASKGYDCLATREPGGTSLGQTLRQIILGSRDRKMTDRAELFLILADRAEHTARVILPALDRGQIVLCDRYNDATLAYQGYGRGLDLDALRRMCGYASLGLRPDLTFFLDVDAATGLSRNERFRATAGGGETADRFESAGLSFHERVRAGYISLAEGEPNRIVVLPPSMSVEEVHREIVENVNALLSKA
jgi:dTMP kinase